MASRRVALTAAFLALAAGGTAACDAPSEEDPFGDEGLVVDSGSGWSDSGSDGATEVDTYEEESDDGWEEESDDGWEEESDDGWEEEFETVDEVFYCADADGAVVEESYCTGSQPGRPYYLYHSADYDGDYAVGALLPDGGRRFRATDRKARAAYNLPTTGRIDNGTIKTNIVGKGGSNRSGSAGG